MRTKAAAVLVFLLTSGCSNLQLKSSSPRPISSKPPESAIVLSAPITVTDTDGATNTFPAGKYQPLYEDKGGFYFQAPSKVIVNDVAVFGYDGGLYVARGATEPTEWYFTGPSGKKMGQFKKIPPHTFIR